MGLGASVLIGLIAFAGLGALAARLVCPGQAEDAPRTATAVVGGVEAEEPTVPAKAAPEPVGAAAPQRAADRGSPHDAARPVSGLDAALSRARAHSVEPPPEFLAAPRNGQADDLKRIRGIGPALEALLNDIGVWHYDQIASWRARHIALVDERMTGFHGRITRDEWVKQARALVQAQRGEG
ncbi:NADH:ubiquinone oxidoreductase [Defluviimonas sp. WL0075]|uniref:NADH:ubiquinone oxidoreductase n=2 Tax=Albidovulum sediminicola TaxID=2984331 RepID=A0ABT2YXZ6_9RHOB|nr:NADH:ubiquinone oxidoreductase [Defluviimonas sp. WL0075]